MLNKNSKFRGLPFAESSNFTWLAINLHHTSNKNIHFEMILDIGIGKQTRFRFEESVKSNSYINILLYIPTSERWFSDVGKSNNRFQNVNVGI